jgi:hypothetical protein
MLRKIEAENGKSFGLLEYSHESKEIMVYSGLNRDMSG